MSLNYIYIFSTPYYIHVPIRQKQVKEDKIVARALSSFLVGYKGEHRYLYYIQIPSIYKVIRSYNIIFYNNNKVNIEVKEVSIIDLFNKEIVPNKLLSKGVIYKESVNNSHQKQIQQAHRLFMLEFNNSASLLELDKCFNNYKNILGKLVL